MRQIKKSMIVLIIAVAGAYFGNILNLPMGVLIGSFLFTAIAKITVLDIPPLPRKYKQKIQMVIGGLVGLNLQPDVAKLFFNLILPGLIVAMGHLLFAALLAYIFNKMFRFNWYTAFIGSIPAGMSEVSNIVEEIDVNAQIVMLMHLFRVSILVLLLPVLIKIILT